MATGKGNFSLSLEESEKLSDFLTVLTPLLKWFVEKLQEAEERGYLRGKFENKSTEGDENEKNRNY